MNYNIYIYILDIQEQDKATLHHYMMSHVTFLMKEINIIVISIK